MQRFSVLGRMCSLKGTLERRDKQSVRRGPKSKASPLPKVSSLSTLLVDHRCANGVYFHGQRTRVREDCWWVRSGPERILYLTTDTTLHTTGRYRRGQGQVRNNLRSCRGVRVNSYIRHDRLNLVTTWVYYAREGGENGSSNRLCERRADPDRPHRLAVTYSLDREERQSTNETFGGSERFLAPWGGPASHADPR